MNFKDFKMEDSIYKYICQIVDIFHPLESEMILVNIMDDSKMNESTSLQHFEDIENTTCNSSYPINSTGLNSKVKLNDSAVLQAAVFIEGLVLILVSHLILSVLARSINMQWIRIKVTTVPVKRTEFTIGVLHYSVENECLSVKAVDQNDILNIQIIYKLCRSIKKTPKVFSADIQIDKMTPRQDLKEFLTVWQSCKHKENLMFTIRYRGCTSHDKRRDLGKKWLDIIQDRCLSEIGTGITQMKKKTELYDTEDLVVPVGDFEEQKDGTIVKFNKSTGFDQDEIEKTKHELLVLNLLGGGKKAEEVKCKAEYMDIVNEEATWQSKHGKDKKTGIPNLSNISVPENTKASSEQDSEKDDITPEVDMNDVQVSPSTTPISDTDDQIQVDVDEVNRHGHPSSEVLRLSGSVTKCIEEEVRECHDSDSEDEETGVKEIEWISLDKKRSTEGLITNPVDSLEENEECIAVELQVDKTCNHGNGTWSSNMMATNEDVRESYRGLEPTEEIEKSPLVTHPSDEVMGCVCSSTYNDREGPSSIAYCHVSAGLCESEKERSRSQNLQKAEEMKLPIRMSRNNEDPVNAENERLELQDLGPGESLREESAGFFENNANDTECLLQRPRSMKIEDPEIRMKTEDHSFLDKSLHTNDTLSGKQMCHSSVSIDPQKEMTNLFIYNCGLHHDGCTIECIEKQKLPTKCSERKSVEEQSPCKRENIPPALNFVCYMFTATIALLWVMYLPSMAFLIFYIQKSLIKNDSSKDFIARTVNRFFQNQRRMLERQMRRISRRWINGSSQDISSSQPMQFYPLHGQNQMTQRESAGENRRNTVIDCVSQESSRVPLAGQGMPNGLVTTLPLRQMSNTEREVATPILNQQAQENMRSAASLNSNQNAENEATSSNSSSSMSDPTVFSSSLGASTLDSFFSELSSGSFPNIEQQMHNEWIRITSFGNFPLNCLMSTTRLAREGWYYIGPDDRTKCFSCAATHDNWHRGEDPRNYHSPSCSFIAGMSNNMSIHGSHTPSLPGLPSVPVMSNNFSQMSIQQPTQPATNITEQQGSVVAQTSSGTEGLIPAMDQVFTQPSRQPSQQLQHPQDDPVPNINSQPLPTTSSSQYVPSVSAPPQSGILYQTALQNARQVNPNIDLEVPQARQATSNMDRSVHSTSQSATEDTPQPPRPEDYKPDPLGINFDTPRYPNYAIQSIRISSFQGWPSANTQTPREMAIAGFYYAGYGDYVRCFFCGGGLRNWEPGDDPWVEHARWFPKCAFVKHNRGEKFIQLVLKKAAEVAAEQGRGTPAGSTSGNSSTNSADREMQSPAIQSIREMGYAEPDIKKALTMLKRRLGPGKHRVTAQDILEILFSIADTPSPTRTETPTAQSAGNIPNPGRVATPMASQHTETSTEPNPGTSVAQGNEEKLKSGEGNQPSIGSSSSSSSDPSTMTVEELRSLQAENNQLKEQIICKICMDKNVEVAFLPCGHLACCRECAPAMRKCPICREFVKGTVKTYLV